MVHVSFTASGPGLLEDEVHVSEHRLTVENQAALPRSIGYVLSHVVKNAKVEGADELDYDGKLGAAIAFLSAPARGNLLRTLRVTEARATTTSLEQLTRAKVEALVGSESLSAAERATLRAALPHVAALDDAEQAVRALERRAKELDVDLKRNREHLEAVKAGEGAVNPIATRVVALERTRDEGHAKLTALRERIEGLKRAVTHVLEGLPAHDAPKPG